MAKTILIVEDNEQNLQLLVELLSHYGYEVLQACNGVQALHLARFQSLQHAA